jgi:hypothetical protein
VVDVYGIVHPFCLGSGCTMPATPQLQDRWDPGSTDGGPGGFKIVRSAALTSDGNGGYVLDGYGGVHPFGSALSRGLPRLSDYWGAVRNGGDPNAPNFDIARSIALISDTDGLVLDGYGGIHEFSYASGFQAYQIGKVNGLLSDYWGAVGNGGEPTASNFDIAHDLAMVPGTNEGYVMDGYGGLHPFRYSTSESFPAYFSANNQTGTLPLSDYWGCTCYGGDPNASNYDISRGIALTGDSTLQQPEVLLLDGLGGVHADPQTFWSGQDAAYHQNLDVFKSIVVQ